MASNKTPEQRLQDSKASMRLEMTDTEYRALKVEHGIWAGRVRLDIVKALAKDTARAEHEVIIEKAALVNAMSEDDKRKLTDAMAVLAGQSKPVESKPEASAPIVETKPVAKRNGKRTKVDESNIAIESASMACESVPAFEPESKPAL